MTVEWFGGEVLEATNKAMIRVCKEVAFDVMADAKKILKQKAKTTTDRGLLNQFYVEKSKYKTGGYIVYCQGPKKWWPKYHAAFVELGNVWIHPGGNKAAPKINLPAIPFLRPAYKKNRRKANKMFQEEADKL